MKIKKIISLVILMFVGFFVFNGEVRAEEWSIKCWYSITGESDLSATNAITLYLEATDGKVTADFSNYKVPTDRVSYASWSASFIKNPPFDSMKSADNQNQLICPTVYFEKKTGGSYSSNFTYKMSVYNSDIPVNKRESMVLYKKENANSLNKNTENTSMRSCPYYLSGSKNPDLIINITSSGEVQIPDGYNKGGDFDDTKFKTSCPSNISASFPSTYGGYKIEGAIYTNPATGPSKLSYTPTDLSADGGEAIIGGGSTGKPGEIGPNTGPAMTCDSLKQTDTYKIIREIFKWIQIAAPIMLIIFGILDFGKAVASGDNDAMKKAQSSFVKRVIVVVIIILLPFIMDLLISLLDGALGNDVCTITPNE